MYAFCLPKYISKYFIHLLHASLMLDYIIIQLIRPLFLFVWQSGCSDGLLGFRYSDKLGLLQFTTYLNRLIGT